MTSFSMGSLDHVHVVVPDRANAARWYQEHLGFEPVPAYAAWTRIDGGPLHLSADGGRSGLALFEAGRGHESTTLEMGAAFRVDAARFVEFARSLGAGPVRDLDGGPLQVDAVIDFDLCYAFNFQDPWGNRFELNCYEHDTITRDLIEADGIKPVRYW